MTTIRIQTTIGQARIFICASVLCFIIFESNLGLAQSIDRAIRITEEEKKKSQVLAESADKLLYEVWDFPSAKKTLDQALSIDPYNASARADLAWYHVLYNHDDLAIQEMQKAEADDPGNPLWSAWLGWIYLWNDNLDAAEEAVANCLKIDNSFAEGLHVQSKIFMTRGLIDEALTTHQRAASLDPTWQYALAQTYALAGQRENSIALLTTLEDTQWNSFGRVKIYLALNEKSKALEWLQKAFDRKHAYFPWFGQDSDLKELRNSAEFRKLYEMLGLP